MPRARLVAIRAHLQRLAAMARVADAAASELDYQHRRGRRRVNAIVMVFAPLLVSWWIVLGLGVGVSSMFGAFALWPSLANDRRGGTLVALGGMLLWAGWVAILRLILTRRRALLAELPATCGVAQCSRCNATSPALTGWAMRCPFCNTDLLPDDAVRELSEAMVKHQVNKLRAQATIETFKTDATRAAELEQMIAMLTAGQLGVIGLACAITVVQLVVVIAQRL
ncbi:MAG TPA: hypothetical protein VGD37_40415 [Kofleriaceae bacterium]|jgi:hypothetical protein